MALPSLFPAGNCPFPAPSRGAGGGSTFDALGFSAAPSATPSIPPTFIHEGVPSTCIPSGEAFQDWSLQARPESQGWEAGARNAACGFAHPTGMLCIPRSCRSSTQIRASSLIAQALVELCEHVKYYMSIYLYI